MARSFLSFALALAAGTVVWLAVRGTPVSAQATSPSPAVPATPAAPPKQQNYPEVQEAVNLLVDPQSQRLNPQKIPDAFKLLETASRKYPTLPSPHVLMYMILRSREPNFARLQLNEAIQSNPGDPLPYVILGNIALEDLRLPEAVMDYYKARQLLANMTGEQKGDVEHQALSGIVRVAEVRQNWKEAESVLREMLRLYPEDTIAYQRLARALFRQGKGSESAAYEALRKAKEIDLAVSRREKTREVVLTPEAIMAKYYDEIEGPKSTKPRIWFDAAVKNAPKDIPTRQAFATWALKRGDLATAKDQAEAILRIEESNPSRYSTSNVGHMLRGVVAMWERDWAEAEKDFNSILLVDPSNFGARNNLALVLVAEKETDKQKETDKKRRARQLAEDNHHDYPKSPEALSTLAWVSFKLDDFDLASLAINEYFRAGGKYVRADGELDADFCTCWAYMLDHQDKKPQAKELLEKLKSVPAFLMKTEATELYDKLAKSTKKPEAAATKPEATATKPEAAATKPEATPTKREATPTKPGATPTAKTP